MPTHDYTIANATGSAIRADLNNAFSAIVSNNSSGTEPTTRYAYMWWADTNEGLLKIRDSTNNTWIKLFQLDGTLTLLDGSNSAPTINFQDDTNTGIFSSAADNLDITTGGTTRVNVSSTGINVTGTVTDDGATHDGDVTFTGANANILFDKSDNALEFPNNTKAKFGSSDELQFLYDSANNQALIAMASNKRLKLKCDELHINNAADSASILLANDTGSVSLFFGTGKKFETTSTGATVTGSLTATTFVGDIDANNGDFDGTLEADAITIGGVALNEFIADTVGAMVSSNTESNITVTYQDSDNTLDFSVGTLNQNTTGTAAIATTVTTADESSDTTCFPLFVTAATGNLAPKTGSNLAFNSSNGTLEATFFKGDGSQLENLPAGNNNFNTDVNFNGDNYNMVWDKSDNALEFADNAKVTLGSSADLKLFHDAANSYIQNITGNLILKNNTQNYCQGVNSTGAIEFFHGGVKQCETSGNGLALPNGKGIDFSATADATGHSSSVLKDYEEGTWTPILEFGGATSGITYSARRHGTYTKIGRQVTLHFRFEITNRGSVGGDPESSIAGLPYAIENTMNAQSGGSDITQGEASGISAFWNDVNGTDNISNMVFLANENTDELEIRFTSGPQDQTNHMLKSHFTDDTDIAGSITYNTAS